LWRDASLPQLERLLEEGDPPAADTGVGVKDVEPAPSTQRALDEVLHVVLGSGIGLSGQRNAASRDDRRNRPGDRAALLSAASTRAPSAANNCALARPMPLPAPVTIARLPASRPGAVFAIADRLTEQARAAH
jgi:hypothetical protein